MKGDKGSTDGPAVAVGEFVARGEVLFEFEGLATGDDSDWESRRRALRRADLKCAGDTDDAF